MTSLKYDIPSLDRNTRFSLWQVKMRAILTHAEWDDALDGFGGKNIADWSDAERRKDHKALCHIQLHLSRERVAATATFAEAKSSSAAAAPTDLHSSIFAS